MTATNVSALTRTNRDSGDKVGRAHRHHSCCVDLHVKANEAGNLEVTGLRRK